MRAATASAIRSGRMCNPASMQVTFTPGRFRVSASSSRASAPQPMTRTRGASAVRAAVGPPGSSRAGTSLLDEGARHLGGDPRVAAVGVGAAGGPELLVARRAADEDDDLLPE